MPIPFAKKDLKEVNTNYIGCFGYFLVLCNASKCPLVDKNPLLMMMMMMMMIHVLFLLTARSLVKMCILKFQETSEHYLFTFLTLTL